MSQAGREHAMARHQLDFLGRDVPQSMVPAEELCQDILVLGHLLIFDYDRCTDAYWQTCGTLEVKVSCQWPLSMSWLGYLVGVDCPRPLPLSWLG